MGKKTFTTVNGLVFALVGDDGFYSDDVVKADAPNVITIERGGVVVGIIDLVNRTVSRFKIDLTEHCACDASKKGRYDDE